jgi:SAM-dependent methyltransferase
MDSSAWDERYRAASRLWSAEPNMFVENRLADHHPGVGLDLASGEGRNAIWLANLGWDMTAVDFSDVAIERGAQLSDRVRFVTDDVFTWEPGERARSFDLVLIAYLQVEAEPLSALVGRAVRWLAPGGELFMIGHDISNLDEGVGGPQVPEILWDHDLILGWLGELQVIEGGIVSRPVEVDGDIAYAKDTLVRVRAAGG